MGAETYTTPASPASRSATGVSGTGSSRTASSGTQTSATGTLTAPNRTNAPSTPTQRDRGNINWIANAPDTDVAAPRVSRPEPRMRQLMGVCGWAAVLGGVGLVIGIRGLFGVLAGDPPGWFEPSMIATGGVGIGLTVGAFLTVHRARFPYVLLAAASLVLVVAMFLTSAAF